MATGALTYWWFKWSKPPDAVIRQVEAFFASQGTVMWISRVPFSFEPARQGHREYRVRLTTPLGFPMSHVVDVADGGEVRLIL
jgi:hypothetical protein